MRSCGDLGAPWSWLRCRSVQSLPGCTAELRGAPSQGAPGRPLGLRAIRRDLGPRVSAPHLSRGAPGAFPAAQPDCEAAQLQRGALRLSGSVAPISQSVPGSWSQPGAPRSLRAHHPRVLHGAGRAGFGAPMRRLLRPSAPGDVAPGEAGWELTGDIYGESRNGGDPVGRSVVLAQRAASVSDVPLALRWTLLLIRREPPRSWGDLLVSLFLGGLGP